MAQWRINISALGHCVRFCKKPDRICDKCDSRGFFPTCKPLSWHDTEEEAREALERHKAERGEAAA